MTNKNDSVKPVRIRIYQQKLDSLDPKNPPALVELGTLDAGDIIIKKDDVPTKPGKEAV